MLAEWGVPVASKPALHFPKKLYALPPEIMSMLAIPVVDAPVAQLVTGALVNKEGEEFLKSPEEKKTDHLLRKGHEASATVIRAASTNSIFVRATILWTKELAKLVPPENTKLRQGLNKIARASALMADSSLDCLQHAARSMAAGVEVRRGLWLKHWRVDSKSKSALAATTFKGAKLFGESLEPVLVETRDKKKAMPVGRGDTRRPFRGRGGFQGYFRPYRSFNRGYPSASRDGFRDQEFRGNQFRQPWRQAWNNKNRVTSMRRVSELAALSVRDELCVFQKEVVVVMKLDPTFLPKLGTKVSKETLARWLRATIALAYESLHLQVPLGITAHSTRSASTSAAFSARAPLEEICKAATWSSTSPFVRHYKIPSFHETQAAVGRTILQKLESSGY
ncbi:uncharacterized protein LOC128326401 [Hemicordylus capensis]|uniref:uncharacterized protein LOC128326401 n=1 Tax=Hemicordylus capensis TaxID=884348 RepID=UPI0023047F90|nr:uncharacterized protein LOC128326401 [Hemicordylus capensis]